MQTVVDSSLANKLRKALLNGVVIAFAPILIGRLLIPTTAFISVAGSITILFIYGWLAVIGPSRLCRRHADILRAEGDYEDFARSGLSDFNAFIMEDFMGATFFHLLLGPLVAAILGIPGGLLGMIGRRFQK
jgi:hypothetical protein